MTWMRERRWAGGENVRCSGGVVSAKWTGDESGFYAVVVSPRACLTAVTRAGWSAIIAPTWRRRTHLFVPGEIRVRVRIAVLSDVVEYVEEQAACFLPYSG